MAIILPHHMTSAEIRVLQEIRRLNADRITIEAINAIKHPAGGGEAPAVGLVAKGFLAADGDGFSVTGKAKEFLAIDARPLTDEPATPGASASADASSAGA